MQVQQLLHQQYSPVLEVLGSPYPPPAWRAALAQAVGLVQMGALGGVMFGEKLFEAAGVPVPVWYATNVAANRLGTGIGVWFAGNMLNNALISTGAFEVYYDGRLVFSKLTEGRMPTGQELLTAIGEPALPSDSAAAAGDSDAREKL